MRLYFGEKINDTLLTISGEDKRHCIRVLRRKINDDIYVIDGTGFTHKCSIVDIHKQYVEAKIVDSVQQVKCPYDLYIAISPLKNPSRFEWFIEKSVEIGIKGIIPTVYKRSEKYRVKPERCIKIMKSAMKQSGNAYLPELKEVHQFKDVIEDSSLYNRKLIASVTDNPVISIQGKDEYDKIVILIGPEGGFAPEETTIAEKSGFRAISFGDSILRTETAGIVACQYIKQQFRNAQNRIQ